MTGMVLGLVLAAGPTTYPPLPETTADAADLGRGVQRTMRQLAGSTPERRNTVRILFYGQSITEQDWWKRVVADLKRRFPNANVVAENRAIGGFASQRLVNTAEHDLYPFYPDLLIFHVYGANDKYEEIIRNVRTRTAAEVLMQLDHRTRPRPAVIDEKQDKGAWWDDFMNTKFLPATAKKYGCGLVDVRGRWDDYLAAHKLPPKALLKDDVHLNDHGNFVMAAIVSRYLVHRPELKEDQVLVREYVVGKDVTWKDGELTLEFDGNRVDLVGPERTAGFDVRIDGKRPAEFPGCYAISRPQPGPWSKLFLMRVGHTAPLVEEEWTLTVTKVEDGGKRWAFRVAGSKTGPDSEGTSDKPFASTSGRVTIDPSAWFPNGGPTEGYTIRWRAYLMGTGPTVAQGLPNGRHTLTLRADDRSAESLKAVRVYRPPFPKPEGAKP